MRMHLCLHAYFYVFMSQELTLEAHTEAIHDVAWAPSMGRSYHLIATAGREKYFKVCMIALLLPFNS